MEIVKSFHVLLEGKHDQKNHRFKSLQSVHKFTYKCTLEILILLNPCKIHVDGKYESVYRLGKFVL